MASRGQRDFDFAGLADSGGFNFFPRVVSLRGDASFVGDLYLVGRFFFMRGFTRGGGFASTVDGNHSFGGAGQTTQP